MDKQEVKIRAKYMENRRREEQGREREKEEGMCVSGRILGC